MVNQTINPKDEYHDLTKKMQAIVSAVAEHPEKTQQEQADIATEKLDGENVSRSYVSVVKNVHGDIIKNRRYKIENKRTEGDMKTEGDPFDGSLSPDNDDDTESDDDLYSGDLDEETNGWQTITERPVKDEQTEPDENQTSGDIDVETVDEIVEKDEDGGINNVEQSDDEYGSINLNVELQTGDVEKLMNGTVPESVKRDLINELMSMAFDE